MTAFFPELHPHTDESAKNGSVTAARIRIRPVVDHFRFAHQPECSNQDRAEATLVSVLWHCQPAGCGQRCLIEPDAVQQPLKSDIVAHRIKEEVYLQSSHCASTSLGRPRKRCPATTSPPMMCLTDSASHTGPGTDSRCRTPRLTCTTPLVAPTSNLFGDFILTTVAEAPCQPKG